MASAISNGIHPSLLEKTGATKLSKGEAPVNIVVFIGDEFKRAVIVDKLKYFLLMTISCRDGSLMKSWMKRADKSSPNK